MEENNKGVGGVHWTSFYRSKTRNGQIVFLNQSMIANPTMFILMKACSTHSSLFVYSWLEYVWPTSPSAAVRYSLLLCGHSRLLLRAWTMDKPLPQPHSKTTKTSLLIFVLPTSGDGTRQPHWDWQVWIVLPTEASQWKSLLTHPLPPPPPPRAFPMKTVLSRAMACVI